MRPVMSLDDMVDLAVYTDRNCLWLLMTRAGAMELIKTWWTLREQVRTGSEEESLSARHFLAYGTVAGAAAKDGKTFCDHWILAWSSVVGMNIREREPSSQDKMAQAQEKLVKALTKSIDSGEEWRGDE